jgi:prevent-host-death family protein
MCYMRDGSVGIRELRQHLTRYLRRVQQGETLEVTDRGRAVAVLAPLPQGSSAADRLVRAGRARPPRLDLLRLGRPPAVVTRLPGSAALDEQRSEG